MPQIYELREDLIPVLGTVDTDEDLWRPLTAGRINEELQPETRDRTTKVARYLYLTNPMARRIFDIMSSFTVGSGNIVFHAKDRRVQKLLNKFWDNNRLNIKLPIRAREISIYGELCMPALINETTGEVTLSWVSPIDIEKVQVSPNSIDVPVSVVLKKELNKSGDEPIILEIIRMNRETERLEGQTFFYAINKCSDATRGTSDLLPIIDWLSLYDEVMFNVNERIAHMSTWLWDVTIAGGTDPEIKRLTRELEGKKIRPGAFRVHNERIEYQPVSPSLVPGDVSEAARMFKVYILGGAGLPEHFFGEPSSIQSSASEIAETSYKMFEERQALFKQIITDMFNFVIDKAIQHQMLIKRANREFDIIMPRVSKREIQRAGGSMYRIAQSLDLGFKNNWIDETQARRVFNASIDQIGLGIHEQDEHKSKQEDSKKDEPDEGQGSDAEPANT